MFSILSIKLTGVFFFMFNPIQVLHVVFKATTCICSQTISRTTSPGKKKFSTFIGIYKYYHNSVKEENKKKTYKEWSTF